MGPSPPYLVRLQLKEGAADGGEYPFSLPLIRCLDIEFTSPVTFFVGENGTGKSTVIEAIAALCKLPVSGGGRNELAGNQGPDSASPLAPSLRPSFRRRPPDAYFLRAEFQAHFASLLNARNADPDFRMSGDEYKPGSPIAPQIEAWAKKHGVTLTKPGWKPELAKRVKQQLLADGHEKIDTTVLDRRQKLFEALQEARAKADAVVTV